MPRWVMNGSFRMTGNAIRASAHNAAPYLRRDMMTVSLDFLDLFLAQDAVGLDQNDEEQDRERNQILVGGVDQQRAELFDHAQQDAAHHRPRQQAQPAQQRGGEALEHD